MEHFRFRNRSETLSYDSRGGGGGGKRGARPNPGAHGKSLLGELEAVVDGDPTGQETLSAYPDGTAGRLIHFNIDYDFAGADAQFDAFGGGKYGIEERGVKHLSGRRYRVTLYVPFTATSFLISQLQSYIDADGEKNKRWSSIESIEEVTVRSLYGDQADYFPADMAQQLWFELWIIKDLWLSFGNLAERLGLELDEARLDFPDRIAVLVKVSPKQLADSPIVNTIAYIDKPVFSIEQLSAMSASDQYELLESAADRTLQPDRAIRVALFDTGVSIGHPLLNRIVKLDDIYSIDDSDGSDIGNHGTGIASLVLYGDRIEKLIESPDQILPTARLESVRLISNRRSRGLQDDPTLYGYRTARGFYLLPSLGKDERRIYLSTITDRRRSRSGAADSYSAALDSLAYGCSPLHDVEDYLGPKLIIQSAGNSIVGLAREHLETPSQAWNVITVGASTSRPSEEFRNGAKLYASNSGSLSPSSSHGRGYESKRAFKPDFVMEGGNAELRDGMPPHKAPECMILGASSKFPHQHFDYLDGTSAAAGLAANLAAKIWQRYPQLSPQGVRAVLVNSARWSDQMIAEFRPDEKPKGDRYTELVQQCGMGVPNTYTAIDSEEAFVTLVFDNEIAPFREFEEQADGTVATGFDIVPLPWPSDALLELSGQTMELRVTLSNFIEPNPSNRDYVSRYVYESCGLRFSFRRTTESDEDFRARLSKTLETEANLTIIERNKTLSKKEMIKRADSDSRWQLGPDLRTRGSVHSDLWIGKAERLAQMKEVAILPASGWWKHRRDEHVRAQTLRYALAISIHSRNDPSAKLYSGVQSVLAKERVAVSVDA